MKPYSRLCSAWLRWLGLIGLLVFTVWACVSHPLAQPTPDPALETRGSVVVVPMRRLDLLFMVDNSPSMKPKQDKMKEQFPKLIDALRDPDRSLPDLRIAIIDSDLGSGGGAERTCTTTGTYGDMGKFQMRGAADCGANPDARWLELAKNQPLNFKGTSDTLSEVFGCLASNVGVAGCGLEHQLAAIDWAFFLTPENDSQRNEFLRPEAYLGIVILTDEDDCSATQLTKMFNPKYPDESGSLRCSTRGHVCDGVTMKTPTDAPFSAPYESCHARADTTCDDNKDDASGPTSCNPLLDVKKLPANVKALKGDQADEKILVAGIYGTPRKGDTQPKQYKVDKLLESGREVWGYWPICYDPGYMPSGSGYDATAGDHGAVGGLRIAAFLNEFKSENALGYSICESDYGPAMEGIGKRLATMMQNLCVPYKLIDTKEDKPGVQADCRVAYKRPQKVKDDKGQTVVVYKEDVTPIPACDDTHTSGCWELKLGNPNGTAQEQETARQCKPTASAPSQLINVIHKPGESLDDGTEAVMYCVTCIDPVPGMPPKPGCDY